MTNKVGLVLGLLGFLVLWRLTVQIPNFSPVMAVALMSGVYLHHRYWAVALPLIAMLLSDLFLGLHGSMLFVYTGMIMATLIGFWLKRHLRLTLVMFSSVIASSVFFLMTNFGAWLSLVQLYPRSFTGLMEAYLAGIPFFQTSLTADVLFSVMIYGLASLMVSQKDTVLEH